MKQSIKNVEDIVSEVRADFCKRQRERISFEAKWQLNTNFMLGNQYCYACPDGRVETYERDYYWQEREVYNHIAPIIETRLAKLSRVRPKMSVRPSSGDEDDLRTAKASSKVLSAACNRMDFSEIVSRATLWSELTGSAFYKVVWKSDLGMPISNELRDGDVHIEVCPPYEIYPDSLMHESVGDCQSIIHAKAVPVGEIKRIWNKEIKPESADLMVLNSTATIGGLDVTSAIAGMTREKATEHAIVIERYTRPNGDLPNGELAIIAGGELLYYGELPYLNAPNGERDLPFIKQDALTHAGCFYGTSMIERLIPVQRSFNALKNRKHEFMNRIAMGVLAVEDGSVDTENLCDEGLSPGKILIYRMGSTPPQLLDAGNVPHEFDTEEDRLNSEFIQISGVSEVMRSSAVPTNVTSGIALQLLIEQDDTRLNVTADNVRTAIKKVAQHVLRLYKQFASSPRLLKYVGDDGDVELISFTASDITSDDVVFDTENEISSTPATKQNMMFELIKMGLLYDENGKLSEGMRRKILDAIGYGGWEFTQDVETLQVSAAQRENVKANVEVPKIDEFDDHELHVSEHVKFVLAHFKDTRSKKAVNVMRQHILEHKEVMRQSAEKALLTALEKGENTNE